jgi:CheY-like chemotaxis protein
MLELRKATLESHDYCVTTATSSYKAMKILEEAPVAAVLLEYKVEGMDVEAVASHIKYRFPDLPIILISAYSDTPERLLWLVDEYVMKSELAECLVQVIARATGSPPCPERTHKPATRSVEQHQRSGAAA